jgi:hypothetical protein
MARGELFVFWALLIRRVSNCQTSTVYNLGVVDQHKEKGEMTRPSTRLDFAQRAYSLSLLLMVHYCYVTSHL